MFTITLATVWKNKNSTARAVTNAICSTTVELKENTSIIRPTFVLDLGHNGMTIGEIIVNANYLTCNTFKRNYWITNITFTSYDLVEIECEVDVLASFATDIMNSEAYINYASLNYDSMIPDGRIPLTARNKHGLSQMMEGKFDILDNTGFGCYVLFFASSSGLGNTGMVQAFAMSAGNLTALANTIYSTNMWDKVKDYLYNPDEALHSCIWLPVKLSSISGSSVSMGFGGFEFGSFPTAKTRVSSVAELLVSLPYKDNKGNYDWRNAEPTTSWFMWLPGVGAIDFPMATCLKEGKGDIKISIGLQLSVITGEISYNITCNGALVLFVKGNIGAPVPVGRSTNGMGNVISSSLQGASNSLMAVASKNPTISAGAAMHAMSSAVNAGISWVQFSASATGAVCGWATPLSLQNVVRLFAIPRELAENPYGDLKEVIGAPVFKYGKLSDYAGGKVFCSNINYKWTGSKAPTSEEYDMIRTFFTSSEGVFLEDTQ